MSEPTPNHRERLLDLSSQTVVPDPNRLELTDPASTLPPPPDLNASAPSTEAETAEANRIAQKVANQK